MNVKIRAEVILNPDSTYPVIFEPYKFDISQFGEAERKWLDFEIINVSAEDLDLTLIDMPTDIFTLKLPKKIKAGKSVEGRIEINDAFVAQEFEKSITVQLNDKATSRYTIPVKRIIRIPGKPTANQNNAGH